MLKCINKVVSKCIYTLCQLHELFSIKVLTKLKLPISVDVKLFYLITFVTCTLMHPQEAFEAKLLKRLILNLIC